MARIVVPHEAAHEAGNNERRRFPRVGDYRSVRGDTCGEGCTHHQDGGQNPASSKVKHAGSY
ncbi:hypothetical protein SBA1_290077 [Candidatus Sulfotelmatobacter kueseliae]|uniref:Uncharacterized protein n=1 Tax=Candidatus Sulfotelmatobacter kueseliae TaxID=2042962 RepID=A0A2U3KJ86_9BACT|nr:hypothetical protein SBA1_290077 [Candidatus Sulfotelmatobacter kueseliae]